MNTGKTIYVYFDHRSARQAPVLLGTLTAQQVRGKEVFSFEFSKDWLREHPGQALDPDLQLYAGPQFTLKPNFGLKKGSGRLFQCVGNIVLRLIGIKVALGIPFPFRWGIAPITYSVLDWRLDQIPRKTLAKQYRKELIPRQI